MSASQRDREGDRTDRLLDVVDRALDGRGIRDIDVDRLTSCTRRQFVVGLLSCDVESDGAGDTVRLWFGRT